MSPKHEHDRSMALYKSRQCDIRCHLAERTHPEIWQNEPKLYNSALRSSARLMATADGRNWICKGFHAVRGINLKA